jgi:hypothetical protein
MTLHRQQVAVQPLYNTAVLTRELKVCLLDVSGSGCLIESNRPIEVGTAATFRVMLDGKEYVDDVQVLRCIAIAGAGSTYHVGVQFLWTAMPDERSIRRAIARQATRSSSRMQSV